MPVSFQVASHKARRIFCEAPCSNVEEFFQTSCYSRWKESSEILQTSITQDALPTLVAHKNGFVRTVVEAYGQHNHLKIRPDDVWIAILAQLSFYVNAHAEELRDYFVAHEGKKRLVVQTIGTRYTVDFGALARQMSQRIKENVVDTTLVEWILPDFTTSTVHDTTICSVLLMSTLESYFSYRMHLVCGLPSVTLEGEREDWQRLYDRLDRLTELGDEPTLWAGMLRPILQRFVKAFDGEPDIEFWNHVVNKQGGFCEPELLSGWITAFCVWNHDGVWQPPKQLVSTNSVGSTMAPGPESHGAPTYTLDGVPYFTCNMSNLPWGYCDVDVDLNDNGEHFDCKMVAGHVASAVSRLKEGGTYDTLSPAPHWFMYVKAKKPRRG